MELSSDAKQWEAYVVRRVEQYNTSAYGEKPDDYDDCAVCRNKRWVWRVHGRGKGAHLRAARCTCVELIRRAELTKRSGMEQLLKQCGFENYLVRAPWQKVVLDCVRACADTDKWLLLCGQSGCGKTHLAAALSRELIAGGEKVLYMSWPGQIRGICAASFDYDRREQLLRPFKDTPVLLLDDLFKTRLDSSGVPEVSRQELDVAFELIDHRAVRGLRTLITCEVGTAALKRLSEALFGRIVQQAGEFVREIRPSPDRNWRTKPA